MTRVTWSNSPLLYNPDLTKVMLPSKDLGITFLGFGESRDRIIRILAMMYFYSHFPRLINGQ